MAATIEQRFEYKVLYKSVNRFEFRISWLR